MPRESSSPIERAARLALAAVLLLVGLGAARWAPASAQPRSEAELEETDCPFVLPDFLDEGDDVTCGYVTVPTFHAEPDGDTIRLAVAVLASTGRNPADEPLILLNGGPGQPSEPILAGFDPDVEGSLAPLLERQDVVLFDQRGTGYSEPGLYCSTDVPPTPGATPEPADVEETAGEAVGSLADEAVACRETLEGEGIDLEAYTTPENAADIEDIRVALGEDQVDLLGISYGSRLALTAMREYPDSIRSVILDSPVPPQIEQVAGQIVAFDAALTRVFDGCAADPDCDETYGDIESKFLDVIDTLEREPIEATYEDLATGEEVDLPVDGETFVGLVYFSVFVGPLIGVAPALIATADLGAPDVMELILPFIATFGAGFSTGMQLAVNCQDEIGFSSLEDGEALIADAGVRDELAGGFGLGDLGFYEACDELGLDPERRIENRAVESTIPTLIMSGAYDPITPTEYGEIALETLPNGQQVDFPNAGHDPLSSVGPCALGIAVAFLDTPDDPVDASCADDLEVDFSP